MDIDSERVQQGVASTTNGPRRSSRQGRPRNRLSMSTGGLARIRPSSSKQAATAPHKLSTDLFEDSVHEELPAIVINQWKPPASQSSVKKDRPRQCTFCQSRRKKCVPQGPDSCQACRQRGLECRDWREAIKDNPKRGNERGNQYTRGRRPSTRRPSAPQQSDITEALLQSFRAGPPVMETSQGHSLNLSDQPRGSVGWEANQQDATEATTGLGLSQRHTDTSRSKIRRVTFDTPSGQYLLPSPEVAEVDADVEMTTAQNPPAERAPSFEIMTKAEYQASLKSKHDPNGMTFKKEPIDDDSIGPRVDNVGCFLRSLDLHHYISNFHDVGLKSREHLKKLVNKVNDKERMEELWKLLQLQKLPISVWWDVLGGLRKVAENHHL